MTIGTPPWRRLWVGLSVLAAPAVATACPVCFAARNETLIAYFWTAVLMSLLPFGLIGGIGFWLYRSLCTTNASSAPANRSSASPHSPG